MSVLIIAEAGVNHNGKVEQAYRLIDMAHESGADAVKFQCFNSERLFTQKLTPFQTHGPNLPTSRGVGLGPEDYEKLYVYTLVRGMDFLVSPFDLPGIEFFANMGMKRFKIPSSEINNLPYLRKIGSQGKEVILSTGMSSLFEVAQAIDVLERSGSGPITLLQCNTQFPTPMEEVNLLAIRTLKEIFDKPVGFSDHTKGLEAAVAAVALGAEVIEKHVTLDQTMKGADHRYALEGPELKRMITLIRNIEKAMGNGLKMPTASEQEHRLKYRKSIRASRVIEKGELLHEENLKVDCPGDGISPMRWDDFQGRVAWRRFEKDEALDESRNGNDVR